MDIIKPKVIVNLSSIVLGKKISVSQNKKTYYEKKIKGNFYKIFPVYYPVGNGIFNIDKFIEDIKWIIDSYIK